MKTWIDGSLAMKLWLADQEIVTIRQQSVYGVIHTSTSSECSQPPCADASGTAALLSS